MKDLLSPLATLLVTTASINGAAAADLNKDFLTELGASLQNSGHTDSLTASTKGDWASQLACTADMSSGSLVDEDSCSDVTDADGNACVWCDASTTLGKGVCASTSMKAMFGQLWDQMCAASSGTTPPPTVPATPMPTRNPTPNPTQPVPVPAPDDDDSDPFSCTKDASGGPISDEATCEAQTKDCAWCKIPILGGTCITSDMHSSVSFLCQSEEESNNLRGGGAWKQLDPSCLGDASGLAGDKDSCVSRTDSNGDQCIWCDAGNDVFGVCATSAQKDYIGGYMSCDASQAVDAAVAVE